MSKQTVTLDVSNQVTTIVGPVSPKTEEGIAKLLMYTDKSLSYEAKKNSAVNDKFTCYDSGTKTFWTGLLDKVIMHLEGEGCTTTLTHTNYKLLKYDGKIGPRYNDLRDYQQKAVNVGLEYCRCNIKMPTRSGKAPTLGVLASMIPGNILVTVPSKELLYQLVEEFETWTGEQIGIIGDLQFELSRINVGIVKSILNRADESQEFVDWLGTCNALLTDETHVTAADSYLMLSNYLSSRTYSIGVSATLYREDGKDILMEAINGPIAYSVDSVDLIKAGWLVEPAIGLFSVPVKHNRPYYGFFRRGGNVKFATVYKHAITENEFRNKLICRHAIEALDAGMSPVLILVKEQKHGKLLQSMFNSEHGKKVKFISSYSTDRSKEVSEMVLGNTDILISSKILTTGVNIKPLRTLIYAMGGRSRISTIQGGSRPLTPWPGKDKAWIIDYYDEDDVYIKAQSNVRLSAYKSEYPGYVKSTGSTELSSIFG